MIPFLAALRSNLPEPPGGTPTVEIRDISPPIDFFTWPSWKVLLALGVGLVLLAWVAWKVIYSLTHRPGPPPPTPRELALAALGRLREQVRTLDAYAFSIAVSGVLREYIERQYHLRALEQTSPEFLASIAHAMQFTATNRQLLAEFLERADMIKFARVEAGVEASESLLQSAFAFIEGGRD